VTFFANLASFIVVPMIFVIFIFIFI